MKKIICPLLYNQYSVASSGERSVCCISYINLSISDHSEAYNFDYDKDRQVALDAFEKGEFATICQGCGIDEGLGVESYREAMIDFFQDTHDKLAEGKTENIGIEFLDLKLGNTCNMACRMCNPQSSSILEKENEKSKMFYPNPEHLDFNWPKNPKYWEKFRTFKDTLRQIHLAGGEPFLCNEAQDYLGELVDGGQAKNIKLIIYTNGSIYSEKWKDIITAFGDVVIVFSLDGVDETFETIRYPHKWDRVKSSIEKWAKVATEVDNMACHIGPTVQIYNLSCMGKLMEFAKKTNGLQPLCFFNFVNFPEHFNIKHLPEKVKAEAKLELLEWMAKYPINQRDLKGTIKRLSEDGDEKEFENFLKITKQFDELRNQKTILPY